MLVDEDWEEEDEEDRKLDEQDEDGEDDEPTPAAASDNSWRSWRSTGQLEPYKDDDEPRRPLRDTNSTHPLEFATYGYTSAAVAASQQHPGSPGPTFAHSHQFQPMYFPAPPGSALTSVPGHEPDFFQRGHYSPRQFPSASPRPYSSTSYYNNPLLPPLIPAPAPTQKDAAALVLLNLKTAGSSPSSPMVRRRAEGDDDDSADPDTSIDSTQSFSFDDSTRTVVPGHRRSESSPPSSSAAAGDDDSSEILLQRHALKRPPPPLPTMLESYTGLGSKRFRRDDDYGGAFTTSLVRTPTPAMRRAMKSSPAVGVGEADGISHRRSGPDATERGGPRSEDDDRRDGDLDDEDDDRRRSPTVRRPPLSSTASSTGLSSDLGAFAISSSDSGHGEMLPPHPGSSSSVSSFHLSTPAPPPRNRDTFTRPFFPSSANSASDSSDRHYFSHPALSHHNNNHPSTSSSASSSVYRSRAPNGLSSPPSASYLFSSPAHPGVSKQLGLTAQPGPGVFSVGGETPGRERGEGGGTGWGLPLPGVRDLEGGVGLRRRLSD